MNNQPYPNYGPQVPPPYPPGGAYNPQGGAYNPQVGANAAYQPYQSQNIHYCGDGKYRWVYEMDMMKNPTLLITVFKVLGLSFFIAWAIIILIVAIGGTTWETIWGITKVILILCAIFIPITFLAYLIVSAQNGRKYVVLFEMDEQGVLHRQLRKNVKRDKAIAWLTVLAGVTAGNWGAASAGFVSATHDSLYSDFGGVRSVKVKRKWITIKVNELLNKNQVYAADEDFDFVSQFIISHCPSVSNI